MDMDFDIDIQGLDGLELTLDAMPDKVLIAAAQGLKSGAEDIVSTAQGLAPVAKINGGQLRESIAAEEPAIKGKAAEIKVVAGAEYAVYVEMGTGIRGANSKLPEGMPEATYNPDWPGQVAQPFMYPALKANEQNVRGAVAGKIQKAVTQE